MKAIVTNPFLWGPLATAFSVQVMKFFIHLMRYRSLNFQALVQMGGMPSSHSASVSCLSTMVGLDQGFSSPLFGVVAFFSLIVMYDATGVRRAAGEQARILNYIMEEILRGHPLPRTKLRELIGHKPIEVMIGAVIGIAFGVLISELFLS